MLKKKLSITDLTIADEILWDLAAAGRTAAAATGRIASARAAPTGDRHN